MEMTVSWERVKKYLHYRQLRARMTTYADGSKSRIILQGLNKKGVWVRAKAVPKERASHQGHLEKIGTLPRHDRYEKAPRHESDWQGPDQDIRYI